MSQVDFEATCAQLVAAENSVGLLYVVLSALGELIADEVTAAVTDPEAVASALVRIGVCHYLVPGGDDHLLFNQLRAAAGLS